MIEADEVVEAWIAVMSVLLHSNPGTRFERAPGGTWSQALGVPVPMLNGVFSARTEPDLGEIKGFAEEFAGSPVPWSIQVRGTPDARITELAAGYGLTSPLEVPIMAAAITEADVPVPAADAPLVRKVTGADHQVYAETLAAGYETPLEVIKVFAAPDLLDGEGVTAYLAEKDGEPVATGLAAAHGPYVGVFNIATPPAHRRRGYGRAVTAQIIRDAVAGGGTVLYGAASPQGAPLYTSLGGTTLETWTHFVAG